MFIFNDIDDCDPNPCQNDGTCTDEVNDYTCTCADGFSGENCGTDIDDCDPNPCQNDGTCTDEVNDYTCKCADGYSGGNCKTDINDCDPNPCQNGGTCSDGVNDYTCNCPSDFTGENCEIDLGPPTCTRDNSCDLSAAACSSTSIDCYIDEEDKVIPNTWSDVYELLDKNVATPAECRAICLSYTGPRCVAYSHNPASKKCFLHSFTPSEGLVTKQKGAMTLFVLRCREC
ncbi:fibropellin-3-like [Ruditapes philippinarum]|uniref:fibropellin-3-like n=1 Tax=Ruditapes philippinarum TaxID=129788 RepID=UPI00295C269F|nr:fibropellin-3-like [Ruditapes philippinarum]